MALNDCIRKLKGLVSKDDIALLKQYVADGMSDEEAVRKLTVESDYNVVLITKRANEAGAAVANRPEFLAEIRSIQKKRGEKLHAERVKLEAEMLELNAEYSENNIVIDTIQTFWGTLPENTGEGVVARRMDLQDDQDLNKVLSAMLFNPNMREGLKRGMYGLKGKTPLELVESFKVIRDQQGDIRRRMKEILVLDNALVANLEEIGERKIEERTLFQKERGSITFDEMRRGLIRLTESRNQSTFLHEAAHLYLEVMRSLAEGPGVPQEIKDDWQIILKYLNVAEGRQITNEHHELWAKSFEKYLMEGKAPSIELQDAFNSFKRWLELIYTKIKDLAGIELSDEIRGVFDRILASEAQITQAERVQEYAAIFSTAEEAGVSQEVFDVYHKGVEHAHQEAVAKETARMLATMNREEQKIWQEEKAKVREEVTAEAYQTKIFIAMAMLQRGTQPDGSPLARGSPFKIDKASLLRLLDDNQETLNQLPRPLIYRLKGGVDVNLAAQQLGYQDGQQLIQEIMRAPRMKDWIDGTTEVRMQEKFPDPMLDGSLADEAVIAVHSDRRVAILAAEMRMLRKQAREDAAIVRATKQTLVRTDREAREANLAQLPKNLEIAQIKAGARIAIGKLKLRDVQPHVYLNAEQKAGRLAFEAMKSKNYAEAALQKRKQVLNHEMYRAALRAKKQGLSTQKYLVKFEQKRVQQRLGKSGMLDRILAVIEGVNFRKVSLRQVDRERAFDEMVQAIEDGRLIAPPSLLAKFKERGTNWQDLTVNEFEAMRDMVKQLEHEAKAKALAVVNGEKMVIDEAVDEIVDNILAVNKVLPNTIGEPTGREGMKKGVRSGVFRSLSAGSIGRILDNANWGAVTRLIIVPMRRAQVEKLIPWISKATEDIADLYKEHYSLGELGDFSAKKTIQGMEDQLSKSDILSIALHWGSEGNRQALLAGLREDERGNKRPAYPEQGVNNALATLDARDWAFIQAVWDYNDTYWYDLKDSDGNVIREGIASTEQRRRGVAPAKVEAMPFTIRTSDGQEITVRGGYMHLSYDPRHGDRVRANEINDIFDKLGNGVFVSASTRSGATYERTEQRGKVVKLGLGNIDFHLHGVIRDLALGDEVSYLRRVINHSKFRAAMKGTNNAAALDELNLWLTDAAVGEMGAGDFWQKVASYTRVGFVKSKLAFSVTVTALQLTGFFQSMVLVGKRNMMRGLGQFLMNPAAQYKGAMETSIFLNTRYGVMQTFSVESADMKAVVRQVFGPVPTRFKSRFEAFSHYYFYTIARMQSLVDVITWQAALWKARNVEGLGKAESILYADALVEGSQTSGIFSDRAAIERGTLSAQVRQSQFVRLWTTLIGYMLRKQGLFYEQSAKFNKDRSFKNTVYLATDFILLFTIEGIASQLIYGNWPDEGDDDELDAADLASWVAFATADSIVSGIPIVREVGTARYGSGNTPLGTLTTDIYKLMLQSSQLEIDEPFVKQVVKVGGTLLHLPSSQTNRFIEAIMSEDESEWYEYVLGTRDR